MRHYLVMLMLALSSLAGVAHAASPPVSPPDAVIAALRQACSFSKASWVCDASQIAAMTKNLIEGGPERIMQMGRDLAEGWIYDAMQTSGDLVCIDPAVPSTCLANMLAEAKTWLGSEPGKFLASISKRLRELYLSNLTRRLDPNLAPTDSPQQWAARAIALNPALKARMIQTVGNDLGAQQAKDAATKVTLDMAQSLEQNAKNNQEFSDATRTLTAPKCTGAQAALCDPTLPQGGFVEQYNAAAATAISTRQLMELQVKATAEGIAKNAYNTTMITSSLRDVLSGNMMTLKQLTAMYQRTLEEQTNSQERYQAEIAQKLGKDWQDATTVKVLYDTAADLIFQVSNPYAADSWIARI